MNSSRSDAGPGPRQALLTLRIIGGSMVLGVTLFAFVAWFAGLAGQSGAGQATGLVFGGLLVFAVAALGAAIVFWRARTAPILRSAPTGDWHTRFARIQTAVIITWALLEAPALFAVTVYFLFGDVLSVLLGLAIIWIGVGLTWPKPEWVEGGFRE